MKMPYKRILAAIGGSGGLALSNLLLALALMQQGNMHEYGTFAFLLVAQALINGVSNALLGTPLLIAMADVNRNKQIESFMLVNFFYSLLAALSLAVIVWYLTDSYSLSVMYSVASFLTTLRWFGRAYCNNNELHHKVVISDSAYTILCILAVILFFMSNNIDLLTLISIMSFSMFIAITLLGTAYFNIQVKGIVYGSTKETYASFTLRGKHSLIGVLTTELTTNIHVYFITLFYGAAAFAPIGAAMLLFRPLNVVLTSLTQVERPRIRKMILNSEKTLVRKVIKKLISLTFLVWLLNVVIIAFVLFFFSDVYWKEEETLTTLLVATLILSLINLNKAIRNPISMYLQACDKFKLLSHLTLVSAVITIPSVYILLVKLEVELSLLGVLMGELLFLSMIVNSYIKMGKLN